MNKHNGIANKPISPRRLLQTPEYKDSDNRHPVKCEIQDPVYGEVYKNFEALRLRVFKLYGINIKQTGTHIDQGSEPGSHHYQGGMAHSNASFDWKDSKGASDVDLMKKSESKDVLNFMLGGQNTFSKVPEGKEEKKDDANGGREDTKNTEVLPGNVMTTEGRIETIEAKPVLKMTFSPNSKTGEVKKKVSTKVAKQIPEEEKKQEVEDLSLRRDSIISLGGPLNIGHASKDSLPHNLSVVAEAKSEDSKFPQRDGASTGGKSFDKGPKSFPDATGRGKSSEGGKEENGRDSESKKSTGRVNLGVPGSNIKEEEKKKPKSGFKKHVSTGKLFEKEKKEEEEAANPKTLIEEVVNRRINDPPKKDDDINPSDFNESNIVGDKSEDQKEESEEFKEKVVPLNQINMELKIAQAEKPNIKVPSMLDDIVGGLARKATIDDRKDRQGEEASKQMNVFIDSHDQKSESQEEGKNSKVPPLRLGQSLKDSMDNDSNIPSNYERISKMSDAALKTGDLVKKNTRDEAKRLEKSLAKRRKYNSKIITNPIYQDSGNDMNDLQDEYRISEDEIKLRKALLANERKKHKKKQKKGKEKTKDKDKDKKDEDEEEKSSDEEEEKTDEKEEKKGEEEKKEGEEASEDDGEGVETQSSVTSGSTGSTIRSFYSLRAAIDERFVPPSIKRLRWAANIVFLLLLGLSSKNNIHDSYSCLFCHASYFICKH